MAYRQEKKIHGARALIEAGEQLLAPAPRMQRRAVRRLLDRRYDDWGLAYAKPPSLLRTIVLALFAAMAFAYQVVFLSEKIP